MRSAERCDVVKLSRKSMSGSVEVQSDDGTAMRDVEGATTLSVSEFVFALPIKLASVLILSSSRGS